MVNIFSRAFWPSVCFLQRNVYLGLFATFWLGCLFFWHWVVWAACIFWKLIFCQLLHLLLFFSHSEGCLFTLLIVSFVVQTLLSLIRSHLFIFAFISITLGDGSKKDITAIYIRVFFHVVPYCRVCHLRHIMYHIASKLTSGS